MNLQLRQKLVLRQRRTSKLTNEIRFGQSSARTASFVFKLKPQTHREMNQEIIETPEVLQPAQADEETYQSLQDYARLIRRNYNKSDFLTVPVPAKSTSFYL